MNRPKDLWTMAEACDPEGLGNNWMTFHRRYCAMRKTPFGWDISGADRLPELGARMRGSFMMRHNPDEVLDLPPLKEELFLLPPVKIVIEEEEQFVQENMDALLNLSAQSGAALTENSDTEEFLRLLGEAIIDNVSLIGKPEFTPLFSKFALIRKATGIAKVPHVIDFVRDISDDLERPIVVFGYHREVMELLREEFTDAAFVIGGMTSKSRDLEVDKFQNGKTNIFLGNIDAAGEAITLTRSNLLAFGEMDWRGTAMVQARKRIHRITQNQPCSAYYLASANSFDSYVADRGFAKMEHIKDTLDL
jgi:SNF2 family DNA or RNA helicase